MSANGRTCGTCSLCCKLPSVPEVDKHIDEWCRHCRPGKGGCTIYALANAGHDTRALQAWLGHKNIQHTVRYTELTPTRFKDFWDD